MDTPLHQKHCVPCEGGTPAFTPEEVHAHLSAVPEWDVIDDEVMKIGRTWKFKNFAQAMDFANAVARLADEENHHPDLHVSYGKVGVELWTHAVGGLSENDFILATKIDQLNV